MGRVPTQHECIVSLCSLYPLVFPFTPPLHPSINPSIHPSIYPVVFVLTALMPRRWKEPSVCLSVCLSVVVGPASARPGCQNHKLQWSTSLLRLSPTVLLPAHYQIKRKDLELTTTPTTTTTGGRTTPCFQQDLRIGEASVGKRVFLPPSCCFSVRYCELTQSSFPGIYLVCHTKLSTQTHTHTAVVVVNA